MRDGRFLLLVDDDETTRDLLSLLLGGEGWTVTAAESGDEALGILSTAGAAPDVILSDLQMPGLSGTAMAAALRNAITTEAKPLVIAMTATDKGGIPPGFDDLLIKPFAPSALLACCKALWDGKTFAWDEAAAVEATEPAIANAIFDRMKASMPAAQLRALYDFALSDAAMRITRMSAAAQAGDDAAYRRESHALKGSCGMVGAQRLRTMAANAEDDGLQNDALIESNLLAQFHEEIARIRHMLESLLPSAS